MNAVEKALRAIARDLDGSDYGWALAGGFAVSARAAPRFTRDVDVAVAVPDDPTAEKLIRLLMTRGYRFVATVEQDDTGRLATARLASSASERGVLVDLQDLADLRALLNVAMPDDLPLAQEAIGLIVARGFHRDRDLVAALAELLP